MEVALPAFTVGIDNRSGDTKLASGAVRDAVNVDFDREGGAHRRPGFQPVGNHPSHSLWRSARTGQTLGIVGSHLCRIESTGVTQIAPMSPVSRVSFADLRDRIVVSHRHYIGQLMPDDTLMPLGIESCGLGAVSATLSGGLPAGDYLVAACFLRGAEEGPISPVSNVSVYDSGGIAFESVPTPTDLTITGVRLYRTAPHGEVLYQAADLPLGVGNYYMGSGVLGGAAVTQHLSTIPPGRYVRYWRGRLLSARGRSLYVSEPMRYGLYSPRHGFIQEAAPITMIRPVEGGIYVGTRFGVAFYSGSTPGEWTRTQLAPYPPVPGSDALIPGGQLDAGLELGATTDLALWLSPSGYVLGTADGQLIAPQERRISLSATHGSTVVIDRRAVTLVQ